MTTKEDHICRLCLKAAKNEFKVDENLKQMFEILLLKIDFDITRDPIICQDCMEVTKKCLHFKSTCIHTEQDILKYSADRKEVKHNIKIIYEPREHTRTLLEGFKICRFCLTQLETNNFVSLDTLRNESMFEMLSQFLTEMDFNAIEYPIICAKCRENLDGYFKFVLNCLESEEKLKAYCKNNGTDSMGGVKLRNAPQFMFIDILEYPDKCFQTCKIEEGHLGYVNPETYIGFIKQEKLDIKDDKTDLNQNSYRNASEMNLDRYGNRLFPPKEYDEGIKFDMINLRTRGNNIERPIYEKYIQTNIIEDNSVEGVLEVKRCEISNMGINNKGAMSTDETKPSKNIKRDIRINNDTTEEMFEHNLCTFKVEQQHVLKDAIGLCRRTSVPKRKKNCNKHMVIQNNSVGPQSCITVDRDVSKKKIHKCSLCIYETTKRHRLKEHMLVHMDVSDIKMQKCSLCSFESKHKRCLSRHMLVHKEVSEIKMEKCSLCPFESKHKKSLRQHMLVHKDVSEIKMQKCKLCAFESKYKGSLTMHMLVHKGVTEIKMYKCSLCAFKSKRKGSLTSHMLVHKDMSEIKSHKCPYCIYEAKRKCSVKTHMLIHKDVSEIKMQKCSMCAFEAKRKSDLKRHVLVHKNLCPK